MPEIKAVISVIGQDQKGVVARFATYLADLGINILDLEQQVVHGQFIMDMLVDLAEMKPTLDELIPGLLDLGREIQMEVRVALHDTRPKRVAVLVSKEAHCLQILIDDWKAGKYRGDLVTVLGNHPDLEPIAREAGLPFAHFPAKPDKAAHFDWLMQQLAEVQPDLIVLARYMQIVPPEMVQAYRHKIINIHPSLLPHFPGARPYHAAWEAGVRVAGCTAHFVTEDLDEGPIILQDVFHIDVGRDTAENVRSNGQKLEGRILADAVQMYLDQKLVVVDDKVVFRPGLSSMLDKT
ncbi:formyltetrahydrofolate deformylase [Mucisphaera sp.]|uniref:formyltetrahydrofolate deformylase n=1 Tax=Mucisphaera sp. TaxID=2913024 RepID=UPI003D0E2BFC